MSRSASQPERCRVINGEKLPAEVGGQYVLCAAIEAALQSAAPKPAAIEVSVLSPYLLSATVMLADGRKLPAIKISSSDRQLGARAVQMLADSIAAQVAAQQAK